MVEELYISGIPLILERKKIKNMYIRVIPPTGDVRIVVPLNTDDEAIRLFVISRIAWIKKNKKAMEEQARQTKRQYITGETHYLWGEPYRLEVTYANKNEVLIKGKKIYLQVREASTVAQRKKVMDEWYRSLLKEAIPEVMEKCCKRVGKTPKEWIVKNMRTKWGSCNVEAWRIWLNLQLAKKTPECLEYVITHELVHFFERNHNDEFKAYMDKFFPNWRSVRESLNSQMLDWME